MVLFTKKILFPSLDFLVALLLFILLLLLPIPISLLSFFNTYSPGLFFFLLASYFLCFSTSKRWRRMCILALTSSIFSLSLSYLWHSGYSDAAIIGGVLPYKDSFYYYNGARFLLMGDRIPAGALAATFRPIFPSFLATLLLISRNNLLLVQASLVGLACLAVSISAEQVHTWLGKLPATVYISLLYLFYQPQIGFLNSEAHGLILGCLSLILLLQLKSNSTWFGFILALVTLVVAISTRAGTFFVLPCIAIWSGFFYHNDKTFSLKIFLIASAIILSTYVCANNIFPMLITDPNAHTFGNFSYMLYGQVMGGIGWESANQLNVSNMHEIFRIAIQEFLVHPTGFMIGSLKAYRDFFLPSQLGVFSFISSQGTIILDVLFWIGGVILFVGGLYRSAKKRSDSRAALLLISSAGFLLSIPFLPPIDGGRRFYTSTIPLFFAVIAYALHSSKEKQTVDSTSKPPLLAFSEIFVIILLSASFILPAVILLHNNGKEPHPVTPTCSSGHVPFYIQVYPGADISLVPEDRGVCGLLPDLCLDDFITYGQEREIDDFFQTLVNLSMASESPTRIMPGIDLVFGGLHYFVDQNNYFEAFDNDSSLSGCASQILTKNQSILIIQDIMPSIP